MAEKSWLDDLEKDLEIIKKENHLVGTKVKNSDPVALFVIIVILTISIVLTWAIKNNKITLDSWFPKQQQQIVDNTPTLEQKFNTYVGVMEQRIDFLTKQYETTDATAQKIWERTKWSSDRLSLLAIINNHNLVVEQYNLPRSELILLRADWTIDRIPNRVTLDDASRELIQKFVR